MIYYCKIKSPVVFNSPGWIFLGGEGGEFLCYFRTIDIIK